MKPEDILQAMTDVDEAFLRKAHRKNLLKAWLTFALVLAACLWVTNFWMVPNHLLARYASDGSIRTGYIEPESITAEEWTTMEYSGADGASAVFRRTLFGRYTITRTAADGSEIRLIPGRQPHSDYLGTEAAGNLYQYNYFNTDLIQRIVGISSFDGADQMVRLLDIQYATSQLIFGRQTLRTELTELEHRNFSTHNGRVTQTEDYDADNHLLQTAVYTYNGNRCTIEVRNAEGTVTERTELRYDWLFRLRERNTFDAEGTLLSTERYHYRLWERFRSMEGILIFAGMIALAATMGTGVYQDRIRIPKKEDEAT